jgi:hypothetical protein
MAQVNSSPGQNQAAANLAVAAGVAQPGAAQARATATLTTVGYTQIEPGWPEGSGKPKRS